MKYHFALTLPCCHRRIAVPPKQSAMNVKAQVPAQTRAPDGLYNRASRGKIHVETDGPWHAVISTAEQENSGRIRSLRPIRPLDQWTVEAFAKPVTDGQCPCEVFVCSLCVPHFRL